jgi:hypothetical protein
VRLTLGYAKKEKIQKFVFEDLDILAEGLVASLGAWKVLHDA